VIPPGARIGFVFQEPRLVPWLTIWENVLLPLHGLFPAPEGEARARFFLQEMGVAEYAASFPGELSGGQRQRASLARAFAYPCPILLLDEPFQSLDIPLRRILLDRIRSLLEEENRLLIAVTHDPREAISLGRRVLVLGKPPAGFIRDEEIRLSPGDRQYGSPQAAVLEEELIALLQSLLSE